MWPLSEILPTLMNDEYQSSIDFAKPSLDTVSAILRMKPRRVACRQDSVLCSIHVCGRTMFCARTCAAKVLFLDEARPSERVGHRRMRV